MPCRPSQQTHALALAHTVHILSDGTFRMALLRCRTTRGQPIGWKLNSQWRPHSPTPRPASCRVRVWCASGQGLLIYRCSRDVRDTGCHRAVQAGRGAGFMVSRSGLSGIAMGWQLLWDQPHACCMCGEFYCCRRDSAWLGRACCVHAQSWTPFTSST